MMARGTFFAKFTLAIAIPALLTGCGVVVRSIARESTGYVSPGPTDEARAKAAWAYFRASRSGQTGLAESVAGAGFTTPSAIGDQIAAAIAADRLRIADKRDFDDTISGVLNFLTTMELSNGEMPGRFYSTRDGKLVDPPASGGDPGWSAVDAGRLLVWLRILAQRYPVYQPYVVKAVARWQTCRAVDDDGHLRRALPLSGGFTNAPDTGTGYGAYAAQGFRAWGEAVSSDSASSSDSTVTIEGVDFPLAGTEPLLSTPYALLGIEFGWKLPDGAALDDERRTEGRLWDVQTRRWQRLGLPTARSEFHRTSAPYALTDAVLANGYPWNTVDAGGVAHPELALTSTRAAFALAALHDGDHARQLLVSLSTLYDPGAGWYEGRYEASGAYEWTRTAATNATVLEALLYKQAGTLFGSRTALTVPAGTGGSCSLPDTFRTGG